MKMFKRIFSLIIFFILLGLLWMAITIPKMQPSLFEWVSIIGSIGFFGYYILRDFFPQLFPKRDNEKVPIVDDQTQKKSWIEEKLHRVEAEKLHRIEEEKLHQQYEAMIIEAFSKQGVNETELIWTSDFAIGVNLDTGIVFIAIIDYKKNPFIESVDIIDVSLIPLTETKIISEGPSFNKLLGSYVAGGKLGASFAIASSNTYSKDEIVGCELQITTSNLRHPLSRIVFSDMKDGEHWQALIKAVMYKQTAK